MFGTENEAGLKGDQLKLETLWGSSHVDGERLSEQLEICFGRVEIGETAFEIRPRLLKISFESSAQMLSLSLVVLRQQEARSWGVNKIPVPNF